MWELLIKIAAGLVVPILSGLIWLSAMIATLKSQIKSLESEIDSLELKNKNQVMDLKLSDGALSELRTEVRLISQSQKMISEQLTMLLSKQDERLTKAEDLMYKIREEMAYHRSCPHFTEKIKKID